jgi:hypothetical protein
LNFFICRAHPFSAPASVHGKRFRWKKVPRR